MTLNKFWLTIFLSSMFAMFVNAEQVNWVSDSYANPEYKGAKPFDLDQNVFDMLKPYLKELRFVHTYANNERSLYMLEHVADACSGNKIKNAERSAKFLYSKLPQTIFPGQRIFMREGNDIFAKNDIKKNQKGAYPVTELLKTDGRFTIGVVTGRSYNEALDKAFKHPNHHSQIWQRKSATLSKGLIEMFLADRFDAIIEYPSVFLHYAKALGSDTERYQSYAVAELPEYVLGYITCNPSSQGQKNMQQFDEALTKASQDPQFLAIYFKWFNQNMHADLTRIYNSVYGTKFSVPTKAITTKRKNNDKG